LYLCITKFFLFLHARDIYNKDIIMNYKKIHDSIISRAKNRVLIGYGENHHIIPKCLGGNNKKENLVKLTAKEHWLIHLLLVEIYQNNPKLKLAVRMMSIKSSDQERKIIKSGKIFERIKMEAAQAHSEVLTGVKRKPFTQEHKEKIRKSKLGKVGVNSGKKFTEEHKRNIGLASKGRINGDKNPMKKKEVVDKHPALFSETNNPSKMKIKCPHCDVLSGKGNFSKWHGDNCKYKK
jgi:hypothetical protein